MEQIKYILRNDKVAETCVAKILGIKTNQEELSMK